MVLIIDANIDKNSTSKEWVLYIISFSDLTILRARKPINERDINVAES